VSSEDLHELERAIYKQSILNLSAALAAVRRDLAVVALDGFDVGDEWRLGGKLVESLPEMYERLLSQRAAKRRP
jgi:hypothetical protein